MKILYLLLFVIILTGCDSKSLYHNEQSSDVSNEKNFSEYRQNDESTASDNDEILVDTLMNFLMIDREFESAFVDDEALFVTMTAENAVKEEFAILDGTELTAALSLLEAFDIHELYLRVIDNDDELMFEIDYADGNKSYLYGEKYLKEIQ